MIKVSSNQSKVSFDQSKVILISQKVSFDQSGWRRRQQWDGLSVRHVQLPGDKYKYKYKYKYKKIIIIIIKKYLSGMCTVCSSGQIFLAFAVGSCLLTKYQLITYFNELEL